MRSTVPILRQPMVLQSKQVKEELTSKYTKCYDRDMDQWTMETWGRVGEGEMSRGNAGVTF